MLTTPCYFLNILLGDESLKFLWEVLLRTVAMYLILMIGLRLTGKRGLKQLSVFELVLILGLGSAAGDPMFYKEVGLLQALVVFAVIIGLYSLSTLLIAISPVAERLLEGEPLKIIEDGQFCVDDFQKNKMGDDEFFSEMRLQNISHLGQIKLAILETNGEMSIFFVADEDVKFGLPVLPDLFRHKQKNIRHEAIYSCSFCGYTEMLQPVEEKKCPVCQKKEWVLSVNETRIT